MQWPWRQLGAPPCRFRTIVVNSISDPDSAIRGVLWSTDGGWLTLRKAEVLKRNLDPMAVDGDVLIHRATVSFIQVLP